MQIPVLPTHQATKNLIIYMMHSSRKFVFCSCQLAFKIQHVNRMPLTATMYSWSTNSPLAHHTSADGSHRCWEAAGEVWGSRASGKPPVHMLTEEHQLQPKPKGSEHGNVSPLRPHRAGATHIALYFKSRY